MLSEVGSKSCLDDIYSYLCESLLGAFPVTEYRAAAAVKNSALSVPLVKGCCLFLVVSNMSKAGCVCGCL